ncbi:MAG: hypothetical protein Tsb002_02770 [Wenzhouxiangellaceae bacterium]
MNPIDHTPHDSNATAPADDLGARLRRQAAPEPPADGWQRLQARYRARRRHRQYRWWAVATAASLLLTLSTLWWQSRQSPVDTNTPLMANNTPASATPTAASSHNAELALLIGLSQQLESEWQHIRARTTAMSGAQLQRRMQLAGLIASVDDQLMRPDSNPDRTSRLWRQRVLLMNELVAGDIRPQTAAYTEYN